MQQSLTLNQLVFPQKSEKQPKQQLGLENMSLFPSHSFQISKIIQFSCVKKIQFLIIVFVSSLELVAEKSKLQMRTKFQEIINTVNDRVKKIN